MSSSTEGKNFALVGAAAAVAPRHLRAISAIGGQLLAAHDPRDTVSVLDQYSLDVPFFKDLPSMRAHLEARRAEGRPLDYLIVCSPNDRHAEHCQLGLELGANVICEKPVVIDPSSITDLASQELRTSRRVWTVLQLRTDPGLGALRRRLAASGTGKHDVELTYVTARGPWYDASWKADDRVSGGLAMNIGVHLFDLVQWLFGPPIESILRVREARRMAGVLRLERATVRWFLSIDGSDLPTPLKNSGARIHRSIRVDGAELHFSSTAEQLHTRVYEETLAGRGCGLDDAKISIEMAYRIRQLDVSEPSSSFPIRGTLRP